MFERFFSLSLSLKVTSCTLIFMFFANTQKKTKSTSMKE